MDSEKPNRPSFSPRSRWAIGFDMMLRTLLVVAVVVMANFIGTLFFHRFYLSSQTRVQLSSRTLSVLDSLTNKINVTLYYDTSDPFYPTIVALLNEYRSASKNISVRTVDYIRDAGDAGLVKEKYKLNSTEDKDLIIFDAGNGHVKIVPGDGLVQSTLVEVPNPKEREFRKKPVSFSGEMTFTSMLLALQNPQPLKAYFLQGHGEGSLDDKGNFGYSTFATTLAQSYVAITNLELAGSQEIPMDCNLLIIAGPQKPLADSELQKISDYLSQGGRLLALLDFNSIQQPSGLETVLARWGVNVAADYVKDPGQDVVVSHFGQHPITNPLQQYLLQMIYPRPIAKINWRNPPANTPTVSELFYSSPNAKLAVDSTEPPHSYPLAVAVEQKPAAGVVNPRGTTRIVVIGDSYFLGNYYIRGGANNDFLGYAANWLLDRPALLAGIGPRPVTEYRLLMTHAQQREVRWLLLGALPGGVLLLGGLVWLVRRK
ncbi:MAG TPA: GldG family protein [Verrucomicrobiae bacterium]|nr:GldG family protein [Verrucomicrobiae bacterium]